MPLYLVHGFKWPRTPILLHIIHNGLEAASPDWTMSPITSEALTTSFRKLWPRIMAELPNLRFVEQYDPVATRRVERNSDFAFVADQVKEYGLSIDAATLTDVAAPGEAEASGALGALRDVLSKGAEIGWWIVYNGDADRQDLGNGDGEEEEEEEGEGEDTEKEAETKRTGGETAVVAETAKAGKQ